MTVDNFEVHLKNRQHKERVANRHAELTGEPVSLTGDANNADASSTSIGIGAGKSSTGDPSSPTAATVASTSSNG